MLPRIVFCFSLVFWITIPESTRATETPEPENPDEKENAEPLPATTPPPPSPLTGKRLLISRFTPLSGEEENLQKARLEMAAGRTTEARKLLAELAGTDRTARFLLFLLATEAGSTEEVLGAIPRLRTDFPELRDFLVARAAEVHARNKNRIAALSLAQILADGPYSAQGLLLMSRMYRESNDAKSLEAALLRLAETESLSRQEQAAARNELATLLHARKIPQKQWMSHLLWVWTNIPLSPASRTAESFALTHAKTRLQNAASCEDRIRRAEVLSEWMLHQQLIDTLGKFGNCSREEQCRMLFLQGRAMSFLRNRKEAGNILHKAIETCEKTRNIDMRVRSKFLAGRNARLQGKTDLAAAYFRRVHREHPDHSYADDGMFHEALAFFARQNSTRALVLLREQIRRWPDGDMADEANWRLVLADLEAGKWADAARNLASVRSGTMPTAPFENWGRILYWQGRCAQLTNDPVAARKFFQETVAMAPVTYYALQALNRLEELKPGDGTALLARLLAPTSPSDWPWPHLEHPDFEKPGFARLVTFARLGLAPEMVQELTLLGRSLPAKEIDKADRPFWQAMMFAYLLVGEPVTAARLQGRILYDHTQGWPAGNLKKLWETAYPQPYAAEIKAAADRFGLNANHLAGLVREESFFNATIRSSAGALGLAQLMPATARSYAKTAQVTISGDNDLLVPRTNLLVSAAYLQKLQKQFGGNPVLFTGAYTAGETALGRWRARHASRPLDLWVELLDVSETRNYIKRVLSSMLAYHILNGENGFPRIPLL